MYTEVVLNLFACTVLHRLMKHKIVIKSSLANYQKRLSEDRLSTICHHSKTEFIGTRSSGWENKMLVVRYRNIAEKLR